MKEAMGNKLSLFFSYGGVVSRRYCFPFLALPECCSFSIGYFIIAVKVIPIEIVCVMLWCGRENGEND